MKFNDNIPIYTQITEIIHNRIISNEYEMGEKISSVRDFSLEFQVNINTVQRALTELIQEGVVITKRGRGNFITDDIEIIDRLKINKVRSVIEAMYSSLNSMGLTNQEILIYIKKYLEEKK